MTYIPKGEKRHWTAEEESILAESWGVCGIPALAKKLNRSQQAIKIRASRLHLGPLLMGGDYVTLNQLVTAFNRTGSYSYKMISWVENRGLPVHNKACVNALATNVLSDAARQQAALKVQQDFFGGGYR